jgi:hypothetical protein
MALTVKSVKGSQMNVGKQVLARIVTASSALYLSRPPNLCRRNHEYEYQRKDEGEPMRLSALEQLNSLSPHWD